MLPRPGGAERRQSGVETAKITTIIGAAAAARPFAEALNALLLPNAARCWSTVRTSPLGQHALNEVRRKFGMLFQGPPCSTP
jgi:hypothetical protein